MDTEQLSLGTRDNMSAQCEDAPQDEAEIIQKIVQGEKALYRELVSRCKDFVFAMIMRQVGNSEVAEELAQETFVKAYLNLSSFRQDAPP